MAVTVPAGYKRTEVGVIPGDWDAVSMGQVSECLIGLTYSPRDVRDYGTLVLRSSNIQDGRLEFDDCVFVEMDVPPRTITRKGDILICVRNGSRQLIGKCAIIDEATAGSAFGAFMSVLRSESGKFLFYQFQSDILKRQINEVMGATINQITNRDMASFTVIWPPARAEQQAIAEALSDADALIESLDQLIVKKRQIKQGAMQELLTGKRRLPGFGGEWEVKCLNELAEIDPEQLNSNTQPDYEFKYISLEDVDFGALRGHSLQVFGSAPSRARRRLRIDDLLVSTVRPNLKSHLWFRDRSANWVCSTGFSVIRCFESLSHPGYVFAHLFAEGISKQIDALLTGSNYPAINSRDVRQLQIPVPKLEEQTAIATLLSDMDTELAALASRLAKARQIKQGMMQELLTGRIRLL